MKTGCFNRLSGRKLGCQKSPYDFIDATELYKPFYEETVIDEPTDPNLFYDLKSTLDGAQVYWQEEVDAFANAFFTPKPLQSAATQKALHAALDPAVSRYRDRDDAAQEEFKSRLMPF